jgi:hypothetical protein
MTVETAPLFCYVHPDRETSLRCNRCERPICAECAVRTPTGYRCRECVRSQQKIFNTAEWYDYIIGFALTAFLSLLASILLFVISGFIGFFMWFISFAVAGAAGVFIANITQAALRKRRSKGLFWLVAAGVVAGAIPVILFQLLTGDFFSIIWQAIYLITATPTVYARLSGFQFSR